MNEFWVRPEHRVCEEASRAESRHPGGFWGGWGRFISAISIITVTYSPLNCHTGGWGWSGPGGPEKRVTLAHKMEPKLLQTAQHAFDPLDTSGVGEFQIRATALFWATVAFLLPRPTFWSPPEVALLRFRVRLAKPLATFTLLRTQGYFG